MMIGSAVFAVVRGAAGAAGAWFKERWAREREHTARTADAASEFADRLGAAADSVNYVVMSLAAGREVDDDAFTKADWYAGQAAAVLPKAALLFDAPTAQAAREAARSARHAGAIVAALRTDRRRLDEARAADADVAAKVQQFEDAVRPQLRP